MFVLIVQIYDHIWHNMSNYQQSEHALHIPRNKHEYGPTIVIMSLLHPAYKGQQMTLLENLH